MAAAQNGLESGDVYPCIDGRGVQIRVAQNGLNGAQIGLALKQMSRASMTENVRRDLLAQPGRAGVFVNSLGQLVGRYGARGKV